MRIGQGHYVLGWLIVVTAHNWPALLSGTLAIVAARRAWQQPNRSRLAALYGAALLLTAYEYHKHVAPQLQDAANYLLMFELLFLNRAAWLLVGPIATAALATIALGFWGYGGWQWWRSRLQAQHAGETTSCAAGHSEDRQRLEAYTPD
jgi:hypothetical protein